MYDLFQWQKTDKIQMVELFYFYVHLFGNNEFGVLAIHIF